MSAIKPETVFVIVEDIWPEGFVVHAVCSTLDSAVTTVSKIDVPAGCLDIEEVPSNTPLTESPEKSKYTHGTLIDSTIAVYDAMGNLTKLI